MTIAPEKLLALGKGVYSEVRLLDRGPFAGNYAHLARMAFTVGVMVSSATDATGWLTRWCYPSYVEAKRALDAWDGDGDPPGAWIKQKGMLTGGGYGDRSRIPQPFEATS